MNKIVLVVLTLMIPLSANAEPSVSSAYRLMQDCKLIDKDANALSEEDWIKTGYCLGYFSGLREYASVHNSLHQIVESKEPNLDRVMPFFCTPDGVTNGQLIKIFQKRANEKPEDLHQQAIVFSTLALNEAFPCGERNE